MASRHKKGIIHRLFRSMVKGIAKYYGRTFFCRRGEHQPLKRSSFWVDGHWHSQCRNCGISMTRIKKRKWIIAE